MSRNSFGRKAKSQKKAVETASGELKLTVHLCGQRVHVGGRSAESPGEVISIAAKGSLSSLTLLNSLRHYNEFGKNEFGARNSLLSQFGVVLFSSHARDQAALEGI